MSTQSCLLLAVAFIIFNNILLAQNDVTQNTSDYEALDKLYEEMDNTNADFRKLHHFAKLATDHYTTTENWPLYIESLCAMAGFYYTQDKFADFASTVDSLNLPLQKHLTNSDFQFYLAHNTIARYYISLGDYKKAISLLQPILVDLDKCENTYLKSALIDKLTESFLIKGDFYQAEKNLLQNFHLKSDTYSKSLALKQLAEINDKQYRFAQALENVRAAIDTLYTGPISDIENVLLAKCRLKEYEYLIELKDLDQLYKFDSRHASLNKLISDRDLIHYKRLKAEHLHLSGQSTQALFLIEQVLDQLKKQHKTESENNQLELVPYFLTKAKLELGQITETTFSTLQSALSAMKVSLENCTINGVNDYNRESTIKILRLLIEQARRTDYCPKKFSSTQCLINLAIHLIDEIRTKNTNQSHIKFWAEYSQAIYDFGIQEAISKSNTEEVLLLMEGNKSNLLEKEMMQDLAQKAAGVPDSLLKQKILLQEVLDQNDKIIKAQVKLKDEKGIEKTNTQITKTQIELEQLNNYIAVNYPIYNDLVYNNKALTLKQTQSLLDKETALIEYFVSDENLYTCVVTKNQLEIFNTAKANKLRELFDDFTKTILSPNKEDSSEISHSLSKILFDEAGKHLSPGIKNIVIIPDDVLTNFPFEILVHKSQHLIESYNIHYQYSIALWNIIKNKNNKHYDSDFSGYGFQQHSNSPISSTRNCNDEILGRLTCSNKEISEISDLLSAKKVNWQSNFGNLIKANSRITHLATHSCINLEKPEESKIYFDNDYKTLKDISKVNFESELTVLSSCESGLGKLVKGEGGLSISKAFFQAGAKSTLVSLWQVDDCSTAQIMTLFYEELSSGQKKNEALRNAKLQYLKTAHPSRLHPFYWAGFVLVGDEGAVWGDSLNDSSILYLSILCPLFISIGIFILKKGKF